MKKSKTILLLGILFASSIISCKIGSESSDKLSNETSSELSSSESSSETSSEPSSESSSEESESSSEEYETNSESSSEIEGTSITITFDTDGGNEIKEMAVFRCFECVLYFFFCFVNGRLFADLGSKQVKI